MGETTLFRGAGSVSVDLGSSFIGGIAPLGGSQPGDFAVAADVGAIAPAAGPSGALVPTVESVEQSAEASTLAEMQRVSDAAEQGRDVEQEETEIAVGRSTRSVSISLGGGGVGLFSSIVSGIESVADFITDAADGVGDLVAAGVAGTQNVQRVLGRGAASSPAAVVAAATGGDMAGEAQLASLLGVNPAALLRLLRGAGGLATGAAVGLGVSELVDSGGAGPPGVSGVQIGGVCPGMFHTTPTGQRRMNSVTMVQDDTGKLGFAIAAVPKGWKVRMRGVSGPRRHHHHPR